MQSVFIHQGFDLGQLDHLMPYGVRIRACQGRPANPARGRTLIAHPAAFVDGVACSLMPFVTDLSTTLATTRRAWLPGGRTWSITRGWLRTVVRTAPALFSQSLILGAPAADVLCQRSQPVQHPHQRLLDTGRCERSVFRRNVRACFS
jgi:hypothetical protein